MCTHTGLHERYSEELPDPQPAQDQPGAERNENTGGIIQTSLQHYSYLLTAEEQFLTLLVFL